MFKIYILNLMKVLYIIMSNSVTIPKLAKYGYKKEAAITERTYIVALPTDGDISPGESFTMNPTLTKGSTLKCIYGPLSYGTFQVKFSGVVANNYLDGSANCFISKLSTDAGGNQLEDFNLCNVYMPCVYDFCVNPMTRNGFYSAFGNANYNTFNIAANIDYLAETRKGQLVASTVNGAYANFAFVLPSIVGGFSKKLFPLSEINGGLNMTFTTETYINALKAGDAAVRYTLNKIRLNLSIVEFNELITATIRQAYNNSFVLPCVSIKTFQATPFAAPGATATQFSWTLQANYANARGMLFVFRDALNMTFDNYALSSRTSCGMKDVQLSIGNRQYPSNKIIMWDSSLQLASGNNFPLMFMETMKYFGHTIDHNVDSSIDFAKYYKYGADAAGNAGMFALGYSFEGIHENDDDFRTCIPLDNGTQVVINFNTMSTFTAATVNVTAFLLYEYDVVVQEGMAYVINKHSSVSQLADTK